jgi:hypothetical protein
VLIQRNHLCFRARPVGHSVVNRIGSGPGQYKNIAGEKMNRFMVFMKFGGGDNPIIYDYFKRVISVFVALTKKEYSKELEQFHIELWVDGEYLEFCHKEGCNNLRLFKESHLIVNSIYLGKSIYSNENILKTFLQDNLLLAFTQIIKKLDEEKINIDGKLLIDDINKYINEYFE